MPFPTQIGDVDAKLMNDLDLGMFYDVQLLRSEPQLVSIEQCMTASKGRETPRQLGSETSPTAALANISGASIIRSVGSGLNHPERFS